MAVFRTGIFLVDVTINIYQKTNYFLVIFHFFYNSRTLKVLIHCSVHVLRGSGLPLETSVNHELITFMKNIDMSYASAVYTI